MADYEVVSPMSPPEESNLASRQGSRIGLRYLFSRRKSVPGNRTPRQHLPHDPFPAELSDGNQLIRDHGLASLALLSSRSPATQSAAINASYSSGPVPSKPPAPISWDPPPLFQAYPQSIICATLDTCCLSAEEIIDSEQQDPYRRSNIDAQLSEDLKAGTDLSQHDVSTTIHQRTLSESVGTNAWTRKLFILTTSGHLLQYAGQGHYDRLPEKILPLNKNSVAFASDAIPGRHWVLQVLQDGGNHKNPQMKSSKSAWGRFSFRGAETRRLAKGFLLVLDSAEELDFWMSGVRKEIEALGGLQYRAASPSHKPKQARLEHRLSHRYQIKKNPLQFSHHQQSPSHPLHSHPLHSHPLHSHPLDSLYQTKRGDTRVTDEYNSAPCYHEYVASLSTSELHTFRRPSVAGSSILTSNELDLLRQSDASSTSTTTAPRTSAEEVRSTIIDSRGGSKAPSITTIKAWHVSAPGSGKITGLPLLPLFSDLGNEEPLSLNWPKSSTVEDSSRIGSEADRSTNSILTSSLSVSNNGLSQGRIVEASPSKSKNVQAQRVTVPPALEKPNTLEDAVENAGRPMSVLAPLPVIAASKLPLSRGRISDSTDSLHVNKGEDVDQQSQAAANKLRSRPLSSNPSYGLFPKRYSSLENSPRQLSISEPAQPPQVGSSELSEGVCSPEESSRQSVDITVSPSTTVLSKSARRAAGLQMKVEVLTQCDSIPQRSPAVTDAHFATCFGTLSPVTRSEVESPPSPLLSPPLSPPPVLSRSATSVLPIDSTVIASPVLPPGPSEAEILQSFPLIRSTSDTSVLPVNCASVPAHELPPESGKLSPKRSTSNILTTTTATPPPVGPPPRGPLPAVPLAAKKKSKKRDTLVCQIGVIAKDQGLPQGIVIPHRSASRLYTRLEV